MVREHSSVVDAADRNHRVDGPIRTQRNVVDGLASLKNEIQFAVYGQSDRLSYDTVGRLVDRIQMCMGG